MPFYIIVQVYLFENAFLVKKKKKRQFWTMFNYCAC